MVSSLEVTAPNPPRLNVQMRHRLGTLAIDVKFTLTQPWTVLFGPSGSGKSTILRAIAGLVRADFARMVAESPIDGSVEASSAAFTLVDSERNYFVPAYARFIPFAPQAACLFPHRSVFDNVAYSSPHPTPDFGSKMEATLSLFRIEHIADKRPSELSGGEAQRVNLARAAAATTRRGLLLLDEPFTGLDVALRTELMQELRIWTAERGLCVLSVTHDVAEAFQLGAEAIKIADGKVVAQGPVELVLAEERNRLLAQLGVSSGLTPGV